MNEVARTGISDPFAQYAAMTSRDGIRLSFNKSGEWIAAFSEGPTLIPEGKKLMAQMSDFVLAWTRWMGGKPTDRHVVLVASGVAPARRDQIGDTDTSLWEKDDEGLLRDPWQATHELPLIDLESGEKFIYTTNSIGGKTALGNLASSFANGRKRHPNQNPIITLGAGGYNHKIKSRGFIHVPVLKIDSWVQDVDANIPAVAQTSPEQIEHSPAREPVRDDMNDGIPF
jgi:hypothetical protein